MVVWWLRLVCECFHCVGNKHVWVVYTIEKVLRSMCAGVTWWNDVFVCLGHYIVSWLDHVATAWVGMIHRWSGHAACLCEVKNVVARFTWRQRDMAWTCECSHTDHLETSWCGVIVWVWWRGSRGENVMWCDHVKVWNSRRHRDVVNSHVTIWEAWRQRDVALISCWHCRGLSFFLVVCYCFTGCSR